MCKQLTLYAESKTIKAYSVQLSRLTFGTVQGVIHLTPRNANPKSNDSQMKHKINDGF